MSLALGAAAKPRESRSSFSTRIIAISRTSLSSSLFWSLTPLLIAASNASIIPFNSCLLPQIARSVSLTPCCCPSLRLLMTRSVSFCIPAIFALISSFKEVHKRWLCWVTSSLRMPSRLSLFCASCCILQSKSCCPRSMPWSSWFCSVERLADTAPTQKVISAKQFWHLERTSRMNSLVISPNGSGLGSSSPLPSASCALSPACSASCACAASACPASP
mmetsp:Transcript_15658/g.37362  ORF Transcript_15658/g.37362 Transcript_15658/m.37362 type:complete len:219 (+) Transcript_15658:1059-1715(+)